MNPKSKKPGRLAYEGRITWLTFAAAAPAIIIALVLLWFGDYAPKVQWTLTILVVGCMAAFLLSTREHAVRPLQTLSNLLAALREGDYSIRARGAREGSALGEVLLEVVFEATGKIHVLRVVRGLGHGLDDAAVHAAEQIHFKPALKDGQPSDSTALVHIIFQLA